MSFDQDHREQANISGADFAFMCDEFKRLKAINAELIASCEAFAEYDNAVNRAGNANAINSQTLIWKYEIANTKCRAALANATKVQP